MRFTSTVVTGNQVGGPFGIATANLEPSPNGIDHGVYIVDATVNGTLYEGILHFGPRKTFLSDITTELHLLNYNGEAFYNEEITVSVLSFVREIQQFQNADALFTQIEKDIVQTEKYFLRRRIRRHWKTIPQTQQNQMNNAAVSELLAMPEVTGAGSIFAYAPTKNEIQFVQKLTHHLPEKTFYYPRIHNGNMEFVAAQYADLVVGAYGILSPEGTNVAVPQSGDVVLVPHLAMGKHGERLGKGGGYYDRYVSQMETGVTTVAVVPDFALLPNIPTEPHDQVIDRVIAIKTTL